MQSAPDGVERARANLTNVVEIHHSAIEVSYTRIAATGQYGGANVAPEWDDAVLDELAVQTMAELESMAVDIEQSFLSGTYNKPSDNTTARKTQGILGVAATVNANGGTSRALSKDIIDATLQSAYAAGAKLPQNSTVIMCGPDQKVKLSTAYGTAPLNAVQRDRTIGGVAIDTLVTDFGTFGVMLNRWMPTGEIAVVDLSVCYPVFLEIPGQGPPVHRGAGAHRLEPQVPALRRGRPGVRPGERARGHLGPVLMVGGGRELTPAPAA